MIKNIIVKKILVNSVFRLFSAANSIIPKDDNMILLYSDMGFRDNIQYLYDYLISESYNQKYKIVRSQKEKFTGQLPDNVKVISNVAATMYYLRAGHVFYSFGKLPIYPRKKQHVVQMWHGSPFKGADQRQIDEKKRIKKKVFYTDVLSASSVFTDFWADEFGCDSNIIKICGHPRTDVMLKPYSRDELNIKANKMVIWMPTFRKSSILGYADVDGFSGVVPVISNDEFGQLNEQLVKLDIHLVIKLHPMQDVDGVLKEYSNIELLTQDSMVQRQIDLYRLLAAADALVTDYSSVFYDFMLIDKPIGFTEDDIEAYGESRGFAMDNIDEFRAGNKIRNKEDLFEFFKQISAGEDPWREERNRVNCIANEYRDFENSKRALEIGGVFK